MTFRSKRDGWLVALLGASIVAMAFGLVVVGGAPLPPRLKLLIALPLLLSALLIVWVFAATDYTLREGSLVIRSGPFHWSVAVNDIVRIYPTRNPLSSPAMSLDRLAIVYDRAGAQREIMVSPEDPAAFLQALRSVNPRIA